MSLTRSRAVVALGKRLVAQLDVEDDVLASWMAHHVADLIARAEAASPAEKSAAEEACSKVILDLWRHRSALPKHLRPLDEVQPILRTLASLDLDPDRSRYFSRPMWEAATAEAEDDAKCVLGLVAGVDYAARVLIQMLLQNVVETTANSTNT